MKFLTTIALGMLLYSAQAQVFIPVSVSIPPLPYLELGNDTSTAPGIPIQLSATVTSGTPPFTFLWTPGNAVNNASLQNPVALVNTTTVLSCTVIDANGCQVIDDITITVLPTGVTENPSNLVKVYPNPSTGIIHIGELELLQGDISITVYDITGRQVYNNTACAGSSNFTLNLPTAGLYSLHILGTGTPIIHKILVMKSL